MDEQARATAPWVLIAGGFHRGGGMDKANLALAEYLLDQDTPVHVVAHSVSPEILKHPLATVDLVSRPGGSFFLGDLRLGTHGRAVARRVVARHPDAHVLVNGGNCHWGDINWVHCVHHAWPCMDAGCPRWFRIKSRIAKYVSKKREFAAIGTARVVIANSNKTREDLIGQLRIPAGRIHTVYLGSEPSWRPPSDRERIKARARFAEIGTRPLVVFVGALSRDRNKGFDTLWSAFRDLCNESSWDADLVVAGWGNGLDTWKAEVRRSAFSHRVRFIGFTDRVTELLAAADLLVSPVRYEAYGLNVQEAVCCGVPSLVSASAGIAERFPEALSAMLLPDPENISDLAYRLLAWRSGIEHWKACFESFGQQLRAYGWRDMARDIVSLAGDSGGRPPRVLVPARSFG